MLFCVVFVEMSFCRNMANRSILFLFSLKSFPLEMVIKISYSIAYLSFSLSLFLSVSFSRYASRSSVSAHTHERVKCFTHAGKSNACARVFMEKRIHGEFWWWGRPTTDPGYMVCGTGVVWQFAAGRLAAAPPSRLFLSSVPSVPLSAILLPPAPSFCLFCVLFLCLSAVSLAADTRFVSSFYLFSFFRYRHF